MSELVRFGVVREIAGKIISTKGVKHGKLTMSSTGVNLYQVHDKNRKEISELGSLFGAKNRYFGVSNNINCRIRV